MNTLTCVPAPNRCALACLQLRRSFMASDASPRRAGAPLRLLGLPTRNPSSSLVAALRRPDDGVDVKLLQEKSEKLGLAPEAANELIEYANLLASQRLLASTMAIQMQIGRAEARYGQAEARYGKSEKRTSQALKKIAAGLEEKFRLQSLAKDRYLALTELRGSVNLRDELRQILSEGAAGLSATKAAAKQPRPSALERWSYIFATGQRDSPFGNADGLLSCCRKTDGRLNSAAKAAAAMVIISENLDKRVHRSLPAEVVKRLGGIAIEESALLGAADCKLIECVMNWAMIPCKIVAKEEVDAAIARYSSR